MYLICTQIRNGVHKMFFASKLTPFVVKILNQNLLEKHARCEIIILCFHVKKERNHLFYFWISFRQISDNWMQRRLLNDNHCNNWTIDKTVFLALEDECWDHSRKNNKIIIWSYHSTINIKTWLLNIFFLFLFLCLWTWQSSFQANPVSSLYQSRF